MRTRRVLIIEDQPAHAQAARRLLEEHGYAVRVAADGAAGVEAAQQWGPDAILMDVSMPGMDGFAAASRIAADLRTRSVPVIGTTARSAPEDFARGILSGFTRYLTKPLSRRELLEALDELIAARERRARVSTARLEDEFGRLVVNDDLEQIFVGLLEAVRRQVDCDVLGLRWQGPDAPNVLLALAKPASCDTLLDQLASDLGIDEARPTETRAVGCVCIGAEPAAAATVTARLVVPLCDGDESLGMLVLASFSRPSFEPHDEQVLADLSAALVRICRRGLRLSAPAVRAATTDVALGLLLGPGHDADAWWRRIEATIPGLRVTLFDGPADLVESSADLHLVLVAPELREPTEAMMHARARDGRQSFPLLNLYVTEVAGSDEMLRAMLLMGLLVGFADGRRSGCLHFVPDDGADDGVIVFRDGRVAWASRGGTDASLLGRLAERTGASRTSIAGAVRLAMAERLSISEAFVREGIVDGQTLRSVFREYLATIIRELMRMPRPVVQCSASIRAESHNVCFDIGDLALGMFDA